jgi:hypothetical protein
VLVRSLPLQTCNVPTISGSHTSPRDATFWAWSLMVIASSVAFWINWTMIMELDMTLRATSSLIASEGMATSSRTSSFEAMTTKTLLILTTTSIIWGRMVHEEVALRYTQQLGFMTLTLWSTHQSTPTLVDFLSSKQVGQTAPVIPLMQCGISHITVTIISTESDHPTIHLAHPRTSRTWIVTKPMCRMHWTTTKTISPSLLSCHIITAPPFLPTTSNHFGQHPAWLCSTLLYIF